MSELNKIALLTSHMCDLKMRLEALVDKQLQERCEAQRRIEHLRSTLCNRTDATVATVTSLLRVKRGDGSVRDNRKGRGSGPEPPRCHVFPFVQNLSMSRCERPAVGCEQNASESPRCTSRDLA